MPELSHDTAEDGFHEIQLSGKQLVFLFIVTTSVVVGVFLFGVLVGRGARETRGEEPAPAISAAPAADSGPPAAQPPAPAPDDEPEKPEILSYRARLRGESTPPETLKRTPEEPKPAPTAAAAPKEPAAKPQAPAPAPGPTRTPAVADIPVSSRPGTWLVQVIATRDQEVATSVVKRLASKGYPAFLVNPASGARQPFYKVQVGRYNDRGEAEQVSLRIKKEEQFQSWILR